jgi:hypothetical protein
MSFQDDDFEAELRASLKHQPAPPDFAAKVLARAEAFSAKPKVVVMPVWRRPVTWAVAAGLMLAAIVPPTVLEYQRRRDEKALQAKRELLYALSLTKAKLQQTRERIQRNTRHTL